MNLADYKNIWVFIETECGKPKNVGFELINAAKPLAQEKGCELIAVVIGKDIEGVAKMPSAMVQIPQLSLMDQNMNTIQQMLLQKHLLH